MSRSPRRVAPLALILFAVGLSAQQPAPVFRFEAAGPL